LLRSDSAEGCDGEIEVEAVAGARPAGARADGQLARALKQRAGAAR
jgi:hypothetical protein